ncbi:MAG: DUF4249 domain-containing protein [Bacteroidales bacterium]
MRSSNYWISIVFVILFTSCTQEIDLKPIITLGEPALSGLISPGRNSVIYLGMTSPILNQTGSTLEWTDIEIWKGNVKVYTESNNILNQINIPGQLLQEDHRYTIIIKLPDGKQVTSFDSIPELVKIDRAEGFYGKTYGADGGEHSDYSVTFTDPPDSRNYYELVFIRQQQFDSLIQISYMSIIEIADPVIQAEGDLDYYPNSFVFSDDLFNGQQYTLTMKLIGGSSNIMVKEPLIEGEDGTYFILRSVSKTYYDFRKSWIRHRRTQNRGAFDKEPLATILIGNPIPLFSNVVNGYGIFAAYNQDFKKVEVKKWKQPE